MRRALLTALVVLGCDTSRAAPDAAPDLADACASTDERCNGVDDDCDGTIDEGFALDRDARNCGACGNACIGEAHASVTCESASCVRHCDAGWADCNGVASDGCEADLASAATCGDCGTRCSAPTPLCSAGACASACLSGTTLCGASCVDLSSSTAHCGACDRSCDPAPFATAACRDASCALDCYPGFADCDGVAGCETSTQTSRDCGACGIPCALANASSSCATGTCEVAACTSGWADCDGLPANGCEASLDDVASCGACGNACALPNGQGACVSHLCTLAACDAGFADCDGYPGTGCERATTTLSDCGGCDQACTRANASATCTTGTCTIGTCATGWADCDANDANGCETSLAAPSDCGACGSACSLPHATAGCDASACTVALCDRGWGDCNGVASDGCERQLDTGSDCGICGTACTSPDGTASCASGACLMTSCPAGRGDCNLSPLDGCEEARACPFALAVGQGRPSRLAIDATTLAWTNVDGGEVSTVPLGGGAITIVASGRSSPDPIALDATDVYWGESIAIYRAPRAGGVPESLILTPALQLARRDAFLYFAGFYTGGIARTPVTGGPREHFLAGIAFTFDGTSLYAAGGPVASMPLPSGASSSIADLNYCTEPTGIAVDDTYAYWVCGPVGALGGIGGVFRAPLVGGSGSEEILFGGGTQPEHIAADALGIYWTDSADGTISTIPTGSTTPIVVATGQTAAHDIAVDASAIYWTTRRPGGAVMRLPR